MAQTVGIRTTYATSASGDNRTVRNVGKDIKYLYTKNSALITLMLALKGMKETIDSTKYEWYEGDTRARWPQVGGSGINDSATTLGVVDGTMFVPGMLVHVPNGTNVTAETFRVTAVSGNNLTIVRGVGGSTAAAISANVALRIIGSAHEEGGNVSTPLSTLKTAKHTFVQIFKDSIKVSNTAKKVKVYAAGNIFKQDEYEAMIAHKEGMNAYLYHGPGASESLTGGENGQPLRFTQSLTSTISTNVFNLTSGTLTYRNFMDWAESVAEYSDRDSSLLIASPILHKAVSEWAFNRNQFKAGEKVLGMNISTIQCPFGHTFKLVNDFQLKNGISGKLGYAGMGFIIDPDNFKIKTLRETYIERDAVKTGFDGQQDEIRTEMAFCISKEQTHGRIYGITDYQA